MTNTALDQLSPKQLRRAAGLKERIESLQKELNRMLGGAAVAAPTPKKAGKRRRRKMSPAAKAKLRKRALERWAKAKAQGKTRL